MEIIVVNLRIAAIDIGSSSIRMSIAELTDKGLTLLESLRQPVRLGKDTFYKGKISRHTTNEAILILKKYKRLCEEYKVDKIKTVATTAVREAANSNIFIDNIRTYLGMDADILSSTGECELIYRALIHNIEKAGNLKEDEYYAAIEVGAGNVQISLFNDDYIVFFKSLPFGSLKIKQIYSKYSKNEANFFRYVRVIVNNELRSLKKEIPNLKIKTLYGIGSELEDISKNLYGVTEDILPIDREDYKRFCSKIQNYTEDEIIHKLNIRYDLSETFYASNMMFLKIMNFFNIDKLHISKVSLRDGILIEMINKEDRENFFKKLENQLQITAFNIGKSLKFDEKHSAKVKEFALKIFDETKEIHRLGEIERTYLLVASILHDVGISISSHSHHKHSLYVINAQDFFYFNDEEKNIAANIARYHRRSAPKTSHVEYMKLSDKNKMTVIKLAGILRIADSLDNGGLQAIEKISISKTKNEKIFINAVAKDNVFAEIYSFRYKKELFEEFFGISVRLRIKRAEYEKK